MDSMDPPKNGQFTHVFFLFFSDDRWHSPLYQPDHSLLVINSHEIYIPMNITIIESLLQ